MTYKRPPNIHETSYTIGEKIIGFQHQLLLLRLALIHTLENYAYYPDLFRALRVLIIDCERGRLGELSNLVGEKYTVQSRAIVRVKPQQLTASDSENKKITFPRVGLQSLFLPNVHSRWFALRGLPELQEKNTTLLDFWDYIEEDVVAFKPEWGAEVTRQELIAEVCNTKDVVHSTNNYPSFLLFTSAYGTTAPYFLEIAQETAYEVLCFGTQIIKKLNTQYQEQITKAFRYSIPIPTAICIVCKIPLELNEFICLNCNALQLPPVKPIGLIDQFTSLFYFGRLIDKKIGSLPIKIPLQALIYESHTEYSFVDIAEGKTRMLLKRTNDMKLLWRVDQDLISHSAIWDLDETPKADEIFFILVWSPDQVKIISSSSRNGLWEVTSDGKMRKLE